MQQHTQWKRNIQHEIRSLERTMTSACRSVASPLTALLAYPRTKHVRRRLNHVHTLFFNTLLLRLVCATDIDREEQKIVNEIKKLAKQVTAAENGRLEAIESLLSQEATKVDQPAFPYFCLAKNRATAGGRR